MKMKTKKKYIFWFSLGLLIKAKSIRGGDLLERLERDELEAPLAVEEETADVMQAAGLPGASQLSHDYGVS